MADKTVTVKPSGGTYPTLNAALAGELSANADLTGTGMDGILYIECYNMEDTTAANTGTGWTTDADHYVHIRGVASDKTSSNTGKWSTERYRLNVGAAALTIRTNNIRISDLQVKLTVNNMPYDMSAIVFNTEGSGTIYVERNIITAAITGTSSGNARGIYVLTAGTYNVFNNLFYNWVNASEVHIGYFTQNATANLRNCTFENCYRAAQRVDGTVNSTNLGASSCTTPWTNMTDPTTSSTTTPTFVNAGADDFHLDAADTTWKDQGTDLSGTFTDDIDGQTRPTGASTWDIGCDEYVAAGGTRNPAAMGFVVE